MYIEHPPSPLAFAAAVTPFLAEHEVEHGLLLGLLGTAAASTRPRWAYAALVRADDGAVAGVALRTADKLLVSRATPAAAACVARDALSDAYRTAVRTVLGPPGTLDPFVAASGSAWRCTMRQGVYAVHTVISPPSVPGARRVAEPGDLDVATDWALALHAEALHEAVPRAAAAAAAEARIADGALHLWEVDGRAVASAASAGPTPNGIRVNHVYTPPALRGRGYASALVAALSRRLLDEGRAFVFLHTDLANPVSNRVYERVGYARVGELHALAPGPAA